MPQRRPLRLGAFGRAGAASGAGTAMRQEPLPTVHLDVYPSAQASSDQDDPKDRQYRVRGEKHDGIGSAYACAGNVPPAEKRPIRRQLTMRFRGIRRRRAWANAAAPSPVHAARIQRRRRRLCMYPEHSDGYRSASAGILWRGRAIGARAWSGQSYSPCSTRRRRALRRAFSAARRSRSSCREYIDWLVMVGEVEDRESCSCCRELADRSRRRLRCFVK